jgi:hydroxyacylglutathione hydrolase
MSSKDLKFVQKLSQREIKIISLPLPFRMGTVNCYLIQTSEGFILIDTGGTNNRVDLLIELDRAGCKPGLLKLILLTHGDFDHTGNAAYLRSVFGGKIGMHADDAGMVSAGDMFVNRKKPNPIVRLLLPLFSKFGKADQFSPDVFFKDGDELSEYGIEACVISTPGHSKGSIGILTSAGEFFCGDLLENIKKPVLNSLTDDFVEANASLQRLGNLRIESVYPGHGKAFSMKAFREEIH